VGEDKLNNLIAHDGWTTAAPIRGQLNDRIQIEKKKKKKEKSGISASKSRSFILRPTSRSITTPSPLDRNSFLFLFYTATFIYTVSPLRDKKENI